MKCHNWIFFLVQMLSFMKMPWWRHQMKTISALLALWEGNPPVTGGFPSQRPVTRSFDVSLDLRLNKRLNKQSRRKEFGTPLRALWRHCNVFDCDDDTYGSPLLFYDKAVIVEQNMFNGNVVSRACNYIQDHNINEIYEIGACALKLFLTVWQ